MVTTIVCPKCTSDRVRLTEKQCRYNCEGCGHLFEAEKPFTPKRVFISYGHDKHADLAMRLRDDLRARGHLVWFDEERLREGRDWEASIEQGVEELTVDKANSAVVLLLTEHSVRRPDGYCLNEISRFLARGLRIIPLMVVATEPPLSICRIQWLDMRECIPINEKESVYASKFARLLRALEEDQLDFEGTQQRLLKHLQPMQFDVEFLSHMPKFTGRAWVFNSVKEWLAASPKQRVFWITGAPGVGKTALCAVLSSRHVEVAALHLCKSGHAQKSSPSHVVKSIVYQLTTQLPDYESRLVAMDVEQLARDDARTMFDNLLVQPLARLSQPQRPIVILIDALDEATSDGRNELASFIAAEFPKTPAWLRLIITSRPEEAVMGPLQGLDAYVLDTETKANRDDLRTYLRRELAQFLQNHLDAERLVEHILVRSEGVFLYVERFCHDVQFGYLSLDRPEQFPQGLGEVFWQFFERQFPDQEKFRKDVRPALRAILAAREPLPLKTLQHLLSWQDEELRDFTRALGSLFPVRNEHGKEVIKPHHKAISDWLADEGRSGHEVRDGHKLPGPYYVSIAEGHRLLGDYGKRMWRQDTYALAHLPAHLLSCQRLHDAEALLTDVAYLEAKAAAGLVFELADDIAEVFNRQPEGDSRQRLLALLVTQARSEKSAMARMTIRCLAAIAEQDPSGVGKVIVSMVERPARGRGVAVVQAKIQAARAALEVAVAVSHLDSMKEALRRVVLTACASADSNVRSLAMVAVIRLMQNKPSYFLGLGILQEPARRSVWLGLVRPRRLEVFVGCALGLFFERSDDKALVGDLKQMARAVIARVWGLKLALRLAPKVIETLLASVSEEYNPANLAEVKAYKKYSAAHPELVHANMEMIDFIDPAHGTRDAFLRALNGFLRASCPPESWFGMFPCSCALISRALSGDESALDLNYELWKSVPPDHMSRQDFMYRMRLIQVGRRLQGQAPLGSEWTSRVEAAIRDFMFEQRGVVRGSQGTYALTGVTFGVVFVAHQLGHGHVPILVDLIEWAFAGQHGKPLRWPETQRNRQADMLVMRLLEFVGAEIGANDLLSRETAFYGISCFLRHTARFDASLWDMLAEILTRMSHLTADAVAEFLKEIDSEHRDELKVRMNKILPREGIGSVLGATRSEAFFASVYCERPGKEGGLRRVWQDFLRKCSSPGSVSAALRYGTERVLEDIQSDAAELRSELCDPPSCEEGSGDAPSLKTDTGI